MCIYVHQMCSGVRQCAVMCGHVQFNPGNDAARSVCHSPLVSALLLARSIPFQPVAPLSVFSPVSVVQVKSLSV